MEGQIRELLKSALEDGADARDIARTLAEELKAFIVIFVTSSEVDDALKEAAGIVAAG